VRLPAEGLPLKTLRANFKTIGAVHVTGLTLRLAMTRALADIDVRGARAETVALYGAVVDDALIWDLGAPYNVISDAWLQPRVLVQPSYAPCCGWDDINGFAAIGMLHRDDRPGGG
jgi:hypothetical protein